MGQQERIHRYTLPAGADPAAYYGLDAEARIVAAHRQALARRVHRVHGMVHRIGDVKRRASYIRRILAITHAYRNPQAAAVIKLRRTNMDSAMQQRMGIAVDYMRRNIADGPHQNRRRRLAELNALVETYSTPGAVAAAAATLGSLKRPLKPQERMLMALADRLCPVPTSH